MENINLSLKIFPSYYSIYKLNKREKGDYLNTWFIGKKIYASETKKYKVKFKRGEISDFLIIDEIWTLKKTDKITTLHLYNEKYNPIKLAISLTKSQSYHLQARIYSLDDSSYGIEFEDTLNNLINIRKELMLWINKHKEINGDAFIEYCINLGANPKSVDYN